MIIADVCHSCLDFIVKEEVYYFYPKLNRPVCKHCYMFLIEEMGVSADSFIAYLDREPFKPFLVLKEDLAKA